MKITNENLIGELERLAAALPWDEVELQMHRKPEAIYCFTAYTPSNPQFGFDYIFGHGDTPSEAVDKLLKQAQRDGRDPEIARQKKIRQAEEIIAKLRAVIIGLPPYRPNRELGNGEASITQNPGTVDV